MKLFPNYTYKSALTTYNSLNSININIIFLVLHPYRDEKKSILSGKDFPPRFYYPKSPCERAAVFQLIHNPNNPLPLFQFILKCIFNSCQRRDHRDFPAIFIFHILPASSIQR